MFPILPFTDYQYFTKVKSDPEKWGAERAYARSAPHFSGFFQLFRDLLIIDVHQVLFLHST